MDPLKGECKAACFASILETVTKTKFKVINHGKFARFNNHDLDVILLDLCVDPPGSNVKDLPKNLARDQNLSLSLHCSAVVTSWCCSRFLIYVCSCHVLWIVHCCSGISRGWGNHFSRLGGWQYISLALWRITSLAFCHFSWTVFP